MTILDRAYHSSDPTHTDGHKESFSIATRYRHSGSADRKSLSYSPED